MLGPVVLLLFSAGLDARDETRKAAHALAVGAALAEGVHVALAVFGLAPYLLARPEIAVGLRRVAGLALVALAVLAWRARAAERPFIAASAPRAFVLGATLVLMNPGFLVTWLAVLAVVSSHAETRWGAPFVL